MNHQVTLTPNQEMVWNVLSASGMPLGAYALLDQLKGSNFKAPLQVYRALDKLVELGMVHRLESLNARMTTTGPGPLVGGVIIARWRPRNIGWIALAGLSLYGLAPLGLAVLAPLAQAVGVEAVLLACGLACLIAPLLAMLQPSSRRFSK